MRMNVNMLSAALIAGCIYCFYTVRNTENLCQASLHRSRKISMAQFGSAMEQLHATKKNLDAARATIASLEREVKALGAPAPATATRPAAGAGAVATLQELQASDHMSLTALVIICASRADYLRRTLTSVYDNMGKNTPTVYISQDLNVAAVTAVIEEFVKSHGAVHLRHPKPDLSDVPKREGTSYHAIARHYGWVLGQVFDTHHHPTAIILEEDMYVAPDFFEYFAATTPLLLHDPSILCVSAWNDNGQRKYVHDPAALYRSDFFPGLGWMLSSKLWAELRTKWPRGYWDDWLRLPENRRDRACIRPEISRTYTFGAQGSSHGQFYEKYLKPMMLNDHFVEFTKLDLSYLRKETYDPWLKRTVDAAQKVSIDAALGSAIAVRDIRVSYVDRDFRNIARRFAIMDDEKAGIRRAAYSGVITLNTGKNRVFLVTEGWGGWKGVGKFKH